MPLIDIQVMEGVFTDDEKRRMIEKLTEAFGSVAGQAMAEATSVRIHEIKSGSWGYGGRALTLEDALAIKARGSS
jgi:4-oxalocrotonate tautomerase